MKPKEILIGGFEREKAIDVAEELFEKYKEKRGGDATKYSFYRDIVDDVVVEIGLGENDTPIGNLDNNHEVYKFQVDSLKIIQKGKKIKGEIEYSFKFIDEETGEENSTESGSSRELNLKEVVNLVKKIEEKINAI